MKQLRGQTIVEYAVLITIILAVFLVMMTYIKRGMQGRWKTAADDLGEQYDPRYVNGETVYTYESSQNSEVMTVPSEHGWWTNRVDSVNSTERRKGYITVDIPCKNSGC